jgi:hypothetical protein
VNASVVKLVNQHSQEAQKGMINSLCEWPVVLLCFPVVQIEADGDVPELQRQV